MTEKTSRIVIVSLVIGLVALVSMNINLSRRIRNIETSLSSQVTLSNNLQNAIYSINQDVSEKIDSIGNKLAQDGKLSFDETTNIRSYQLASKSAYVDIGFNLKKFNEDDTVTVVARGTNGKTYDTVAKSTSAGRYTASMTLPVQDRYTLNFACVGDESLSGDLTTLDLAEELCGRFKYDIGHGYSYRTNTDSSITVSLKPYFSNFTKGDNALSINEMFLIAESEGVELNRWDLLPMLQVNSDSQMIDVYLKEQQFISGENDASPDYVVTEMNVTTSNNFTVRLLFIDNLGVRYEQTNTIYVTPMGASSKSRIFGNEPVPRILENGQYEEGYIHFAKQ